MSKPNKTNNKTKGIIIISVIVILIIALVVAVIVLKDKPSDIKTTQTGTVSVTQDSDLVINVNEISDKAKFYPVKMDGTNLEVIAVKAPDGSIRTAFNTCQVCYDSGKGYYVQEGDVLVCQNCGNRFKMSEVEITKGGCNPVPISSEDKIESTGTITISKDYLQQSKEIFAKWKK
ncbi:MAG: hypothetical protein K0R90_429 [Oscillospiraceae bacterium]|jgi:uncharacterized membrane protein|nr:hypothetical protein [Oscillospiraceae bacterium]